VFGMTLRAKSLAIWANLRFKYVMKVEDVVA